MKRRTVESWVVVDYQGKHLIRPPSEADSIILQVTVGCSHNKCTFCGTYKGEPFRLKDDAVIEADLDFAGQYCKRQSRIFLADGDVLVLPQKRLRQLFLAIREKLPWVKRVSLYGNEKSIRGKSLDDLAELKQLGLSRVYLGLESGHDQVLAAIKKGADSRAMVAAGRKIRQAGLFLSVTVLLGIGGRHHSLAHAEATGRVLSEMEPNQIGVLTLMLLENTPLYAQACRSEFQLPDQQGLLDEFRVLVEHLHLKRTQLQSNHASNYLPVNARLPRDKELILASIAAALAGRTPLKPEYLRAL